jgi:hypothetical protein
MISLPYFPSIIAFRISNTYLWFEIEERGAVSFTKKRKIKF